MRKAGTVIVSFVVFLTLFSMGVQTMSSLATLPLAQQGIEAFPSWGRWAVGVAAVWMGVSGARKMLRSRGAGRTPALRTESATAAHGREPTRE